MTDVNHQAALDYLCSNAQRVIPLVEVNTYNAAVKAIGELIADHKARAAIEADKAKAAPTDG